MLSDKYGLTKAVLEGRKTMTRRVANFNPADSPLVSFNVLPYNEVSESVVIQRLWRGSYNTSHHLTPKFKVGEVVAVAQAYKDIEEFNPKSYEDVMLSDGVICEASHPYSNLMRSGGWDNKMFVKADLMPHHVRITSVRVERLQDISDEDCLREGIRKMTFDTFSFDSWKFFARSPREAFAALIAKVSGKGIWDRNPWVFVYEFELVK